MSRPDYNGRNGNGYQPREAKPHSPPPGPERTADAVNGRQCDCTAQKLVALLLGIGTAGGAAAQARELAPITTPWPLIALIVIGVVGLLLLLWAVVRPMPPMLPEIDDPHEFWADDARDPSREVR